MTWWVSNYLKKIQRHKKNLKQNNLRWLKDNSCDINFSLQSFDSVHFERNCIGL